MANEKLEFFTVKEAAKILRVEPITIYRAVKDGNLKAAKVGGAIRVSSREIDRLARGEAA